MTWGCGDGKGSTQHATFPRTLSLDTQAQNWLSMKVTLPLPIPPSTGIARELGSHRWGEGEVPQTPAQPSLKPSVEGPDVCFPCLITNLSFLLGRMYLDFLKWHSMDRPTFMAEEYAGWRGQAGKQVVSDYANKEP